MQKEVLSYQKKCVSQTTVVKELREELLKTREKHKVSIFIHFITLLNYHYSMLLHLQLELVYAIPSLSTTFFSYCFIFILYLFLLLIIHRFK